MTPRLHMVEDVPTTGPVTVRVNVPEEPRRVTLEPGERRLQWGYADGSVEAHVEAVAIHDIIAIENK